MCSINSLKINLRVPVRVKDDDNVGLVEIDANSPCTSGQNEDLFVRLRILEVVNS